MNPPNLLLAGLALIFCLSGTILDAQTDWELKKDIDGIQVYYRESADSPFKELKMVFEVEASLKTIMAVLNDADSFKKWIYKLKDIKVLERPSDNVLVYYYEMDFPWPLYNRDAIAESSYWQDPETKVIYTENYARPDRLPEEDGVIRLRRTDVKWKITPMGETRAHIEYYLLSDPGGSLPAWLVNMALDRGPVKSMQSFRELLKDDKYRKKQLAWVENFGASADEGRN
jgi:hypothetical protein